MGKVYGWQMREPRCQHTQSPSPAARPCNMRKQVLPSSGLLLCPIHDDASLRTIKERTK